MKRQNTRLTNVCATVSTDLLGKAARTTKQEMVYAHKSVSRALVTTWELQYIDRDGI